MFLMRYTLYGRLIICLYLIITVYEACYVQNATKYCKPFILFLFLFFQRNQECHKQCVIGADAEYHFDLLLHISVYDNIHGAFTTA